MQDIENVLEGGKPLPWTVFSSSNPDKWMDLHRHEQRLCPLCSATTPENLDNEIHLICFTRYTSTSVSETQQTRASEVSPGKCVVI